MQCFPCLIITSVIILLLRIPFPVSGTTPFWATSVCTQILSKCIVCRVNGIRADNVTRFCQPSSLSNPLLFCLVIICSPHTCFWMYSCESLISELCQVSSSARCVGVQRGVRTYHLDNARDNAKVRDHDALSHPKASQQLYKRVQLSKLEHICIGKMDKVSN